MERFLELSFRRARRGEEALGAFLFVARTHGFLVRSREQGEEGPPLLAARALLLRRIPELVRAFDVTLLLGDTRYVRVLLVHLRHAAFPLDDFVEYSVTCDESYSCVIVIWRFAFAIFPRTASVGKLAPGCTSRQPFSLPPLCFAHLYLSIPRILTVF